MTDSHLRFTLREMRALLGVPKVWGVMLATAFLLGLSGPFETNTMLRFAPRLAYWFIVVLATFGLGSFIHTLLFRVFAQRNFGPWVKVLIAACVTGLAVGGLLLLINWAALGVAPIQQGYTFWLVLNAVIISLVISVTIGMFSHKEATPLRQSQGVKLLHRLELDKRGALLALSVQDHYVEVVTSKGAALILMRLSDAMAETEGVRGMQVHRSHWVAIDAVKSAKRTGDKAVLTLKGDRDIPVSRTYLKAVRDAGLLLK